MIMAETIDAPDVALDSPAHTDPPAAPVLAPPTSGQTLLPPPTSPPPPAPPAPEPTSEPTPASITTGPSAIFAESAATIPDAHAAPVLPRTVAATPSATAAPTSKPSTAFDVGAYLDSESQKKQAPRKSRGRWLFRLIVLGLLGAAGWVGYEHGPEVYDEYIRGEEAGAQTEREAPRMFPNVAAASAPIRTAEFTLVGLPETPEAIYRVTTDFETSVSQVDITRVSGPDLQVLTYGPDAMIRRADGDQWYILDRGQFPLDGRLERSDWVRRIDELLPVEVRDRAVIDSSTEATISGVATRHLVLTVDPSLLDTTATDAAGLPSEPRPDAATPSAIADNPDQIPAPGATVLDPAASEPEVPVAGAAVRMEVWIDGEGLVRQVTGVPSLGADTITIVRTSPDSWIPDYPMASEIAPLTASALVDLGL